MAQNKQADYTILLKGQQINPAPNAQAWFDSVAIHHKSGAPLQVLMQFDQLPGAAQRTLLQSAGITLLDFIPHKTYIALVIRKVSNAAPLGIRTIVDVRPDWKMDSRIGKIGLQSDVSIKVLVSFVRERISPSAIDQLVRGIGGMVTDKRFQSAGTYEVELPRNKLLILAKDALVKYIGLPGKDQPLNYDAAASSGAMLLHSPAGGALDGSGVTIGVGDNASAIVHVDVRDRLINFHPWHISMHGVHTTLTVAGNGLMNPRTIGMAPKARVLAHVYNAVWANTESMFKDYDMTLTNNSYTADPSKSNYGIYDQLSQLLDDYALLYPKVQNVFASGNSGLDTLLPFPTAYHTVNGGYQTSKNVLTVGALAKDNIVWPKSSRGPVKDGRLKPEIVAYGFGIYSGDIFDNYGNSNGTSMSCPVVTGCMGLLEQRYKQLHGNTNAPSNLLKALTMNGATDVGNAGPDYTNGYGLVNVVRSKAMLDNNQFVIDSVNNAANKAHTITVPAGTAQLKVMLYWHDPSASPLASPTLVNNLDMQVVGPGGTFQPLVLDPNPSNVTNLAQPGVDNLNNSEQVVVNNPANGSYSISIKGTSVPSGVQAYVVVYDFVPVGITIKHPSGGVAVPGNDSIRIYWDASNDGSTFHVQASLNGGGAWTTVANNIGADQRQLVWYTPNQSTAQARIRISKNSSSQQAETANFTITPQPVIQLSANQCPGYMAVEWNAVPGATSYEVLKKIGDDLRPVDTVTTLSYVFSGLATDSMYYAGVRPMVNGRAGFRSMSVRRTPNDGNCAGSISDGDLVADAIVNPESGRLFTSSELSSSQMLSIRVRNLDDQPASNYRVSFSLNGGAWQSQTATAAITPLGFSTISFPGLNLSAVGIYQIRVAVQNLAINDPVRKNDTMVKFIRQLDNDSVDLHNGFTDGFEGTAITHVTKDSMGVLANDHWDYVNSTDTGRLSTFISADVPISGQRSISLDQVLNTTGFNMDNQNYLLGTFNLAGHDTATTEARIELDYKIHGRPKYLDGNDIWVRGKDTDQWLQIFTFDTSATPGMTINTGSLSVTDAFINNGQTFSSSMQVRMGQHDSATISMNDYGNGLTIDNFRLYSVKNDVQLLAIVAPDKLGCGLVGDQPVSLRIYNSDNLPQDTIYLHYRVDGGPISSGILPSIAAKDSVFFTFNDQLKNLSIGYHTIDAWIVNPGDTYFPNDSIMNFRFRNQPVVEAFPYLQTFEENDGDWFTEGVNSSWQYGEPNSLRVKKAASGTKVWATGLTGNYNDNEKSYLYSPCFNISYMTKPMLSFSLSTDIEDCGAQLCDAAYLEYSEDGKTWTTLGANGEGTNWYGSLGVWNDTGNVRWRVASIPLPHGLTSLKLRFAFISDPGSPRDGIAIDDIHVFDLNHPIYDGSTTRAIAAVKSTSFVGFVSDSKVLAHIGTDDANLGSTEVAMYRHSYVFNPIVRAYHLERNYVIQPSQKSAESILVRLFITDEEVVRMINDGSCDTCGKAEDAYRLGITKYENDNNSLENGSLSDNVGGTYSFMPYTAIQWVPYDKGYYAELSTNSFSEFWFNTGIPSRTFNGPVIFPNPITDGKVNIIWNGAPGTELQLMMVDVVGRVVFRSTLIASDYDNRTTIQLPEMHTGMYILRYIIGGETKDVKVLVTR